ncbi:MAG: long-chain fatty acid--CoA ligase [Alphaproteobacteria bacterium]|nr:long-chain fatty acid--CoA ligase [Alphaproteobacteria bacterium]
MDYDACPSLPAMFFAQAARRGAGPFLWEKRDGVYRPISWAETAGAVRNLAGGLAALGVVPGDRVALVAENRPEWAVADLAIMASGAITVPGYVTNTVENHHHLLADSGAKVAIVSTAALSTRLIPAVNQVSSVRTVIALEAPGQPCRVPVRSWDEVVRLGSAGAETRVAAAIGPDDIACMIYTSGTGGTPKGVLLSHRNVLANCRGAYRLLEMLGLGDEVFLSFLPLSHSYEHTAGLMFPISIAAQIYFAEGAETLSANLIEARPTIMTAVPRLYEVMHQRIRRGIERDSGLKRRLFEKTVAIGRKRLASRPLGLGARLLDPVLDRLVRDKVRARFGGRLKAMVSGGAPLNPEIGSFFLALGVELLQGYGQTEAAPVISCNRPGRARPDTVGLPLDGVRVRIADDGEILVTGDNVMKGYWNDPAATARALDDGWLHTGDVGVIDANGQLRITDRLRDFIKNSGGDMIAPARVEGCLTLQPEIGQAVVFGDNRPYLVAVLVPDAEFAASFARQHRVADPPAALAGDPGFAKAIGDAVARANLSLSPIERVRRFLVAAEPFTIANAQLTPTLKPRRHAIRRAYAAALDELYQGKGLAA